MIVRVAGIRVAMVAVVLAALVVPQHAWAQADDLVLRLNRAEHQVRELTGQVEQLQYRNQQLEQQLRAMGGAPQPQQQGGMQPPPQSAPQSLPPQQPQIAAPPMQQAPQQQASQGGRGDAFDPARNPNAPGVPRTLGGSAPMADEPDVGAPGGRAAGAPLDLSTMGSQQPVNPGAPMQPQMQPPMQPPMQQQPGMQAQPRTAGVSPTLPPSQSPKDEYDLGYGYVLRKDYALAEDTLRGFLQRYPSDPLAADAQYWLGESLFQRQRYRDAAESFLKVSTGYGNNAPKGAESLLRLGQSLAALNEREAACAAFGEVNRKYPRAPSSVKQGVEREQKRVRC